jgi:hypothetical protein
MNPYLTKIQEIKKEISEFYLHNTCGEYNHLLDVLKAKLQTAVEFLQMTKESIEEKESSYDIDIDEIYTVIVSEEITNINSALKEAGDKQ